MVTGRPGARRPGRGDRGLGRTVDVEQPAPGRCHRPTRSCGQASPETSRKRSPGRSSSRVASRVGTQHSAVTRCAHAGTRAAPARAARTPAGLGTSVAPASPGHPDLLDREVERDRHALVDPVVRRAAVHLGRDPDEVADAGVLDRDALRPPGRARGVDDVASSSAGAPGSAREPAVARSGELRSHASSRPPVRPRRRQSVRRDSVSTRGHRRRRRCTRSGRPGTQDPEGRRPRSL